MNQLARFDHREMVGSEALALGRGTVWELEEQNCTKRITACFNPWGVKPAHPGGGERNPREDRSTHPWQAGPVPHA
jgi:hypothetical protein